MDEMLQRIDSSLNLVTRWLGSVRRPGTPYGRYRYFPSSAKDWCLYASIEGITLEHHLGLADRWTEIERREILDGLRGCQCPDGYFRCPCCTQDDGEPRQRCSEDNADGITFKTALTLYMLGRTPLYQLPAGKVTFEPDGVTDLLENIFQRENPYSAGSSVWKICGMRSLRQIISEGKDPASDPVVAGIIGWLIVNQDENSGLWFPNGDLLNGVNGLLKMRAGTFDLAGIDIPHPEKIVLSILKTQKPDGSFGGACCDWNAVGLLAEIGRRTPQFRKEIIEAYRRALPIFLNKQRPGGWFAWTGEANEQPFLKSAYINSLGLLSIKYSLLEDDAKIELLFSNIRRWKRN